MFNWFKKDKQEKYSNSVFSDITKSDGSKPIIPSGYKSVWLAVKSKSANDVVTAIKDSGYTGFRTNETIGEWVFVHDLIDSMIDFADVKSVSGKADYAKRYGGLLKEINCANEYTLDFLKNLSKTFPCVCFFIRFSDCYAWAKFENGDISRAFEFQEGYGVLINLS